MAKVTVDISEYDTLREAKAKAEQEVKELKETLKDLKTGSRIIFQTKYIRGSVDDAKRYIRNSCLNLSYNDHLTLSRILEAFFGGEPRETIQYINFKDVEAQVEAGISEQKKKELEVAIAYYKRAAQGLEEKNAGLEEEYQKQKKAYEEDSKSQIDKLNKEINCLKDRIAELKKSKDERIAELVAKIDKAEAELSNLGVKRKSWFNRIFK